MGEIFFITGSQNKLDEAKTVIPTLQHIEIDLPEIQEMDAKEVIKAKLLEALKHKQETLVVEDTSLHLECLNGLPGPLIKWFLKAIGNEGLVHLAEKLDNNNAEAVTVIGYAKNTKDIQFFEGTVKGKIVSPRGTEGFGWDPIFEPQGYNQTFAEMGREEKNKISTRKKSNQPFQLKSKEILQ